MQNDFALLRYLLFSDKDTAATDFTPSPLINPHPNTNPTPSASTLPCTDDARLRRSTPVGAVGPSRAKTNNSANPDLPTPTQYAGNSSNYGAEPRIKKLQTRKNFRR